MKPYWQKTTERSGLIVWCHAVHQVGIYRDGVLDCFGLTKRSAKRRMDRIIRRMERKQKRRGLL